MAAPEDPQSAAVAAVVKAWTDPGPMPYWHRLAQADLAGSMPVLARALDRLAEVTGPC